MCDGWLRASARSTTLRPCSADHRLRTRANRTRSRRPAVAAGRAIPPSDSRRSVFRRLTVDLFSFLTQEHSCTLPIFEERWPPGRPGWMDVVFLGPRFTVRIGLTIAGAGEASVLTSVRGSAVGDAGARGWDQDIDSLAFANGLTAARWTVPSDARTIEQLRRSVTAQAELTRRLVSIAAG